MPLDALDLDSIDRDLLELERSGFTELAARLRPLLPSTSNGNTGQLQLVDSIEVPVPTPADVREGWDDFYDNGTCATMRPPDPDEWIDAVTIAAITRVMTRDRRRVAQQQQRGQDPALAAGAVIAREAREPSTSTTPQGEGARA